MDDVTISGQQYYDSHMLGKAKLASVIENDEGEMISTANAPSSAIPLDLPDLPNFDDLESLLSDESKDDDEGAI